MLTFTEIIMITMTLELLIIIIQMHVISFRRDEKIFEKIRKRGAHFHGV